MSLRLAPTAVATVLEWGVRALDKVDMQVSDLDLFEINEAFAAVGIASIK